MFGLSPQEVQMIINGVGETLYMTVVATLFGYVFGLPWGIILTVTNKDGIHPNRGIYRTLDVITNIMRSIPFLILLILVIPITKMIKTGVYIDFIGIACVTIPLAIYFVNWITGM